MYKESVTGKVIRTIRHGHTYYGNPTMSIVLDISAIDDTSAESSALVTIRISDNAGIVYEIENSYFRELAHTFELTRAGRISGRCYVTDGE